MRWLNFIILLFVTLILQAGPGRLFGLGPQRIMPDLLLILAVILAFRAGIPQILIACWILGLAKDLTSPAPFGCYAFTFGLVAWLIFHLREWLYGQHPLTLILLTFFAVHLVEHVTLMISLLKNELPSGQYDAFSLTVFFSALFSAALAPYFQWLLLKLHRLLGIPLHRSHRY